MTELHLVLAYVAAASVAATLLAAVAGMAIGPRVRVLIDRLILAAVALLVVTALAGVPLVLLVGPPSDILHVVYAVVAPLILLAGRYLGRDPAMRRRSAFVAVATLAVVGVVYRLFTTGVSVP
ncbi:MAG TPA: hypothetical protein VK992_02740 [Candidatus Caenarcaniphilales bacterium]|nr:hypothetical protein [Candidatus Caenarcaniphilales bacterium]